MKNIKLTGGIFASNPKIVKHIIVHCSATPRGRDVNSDTIRKWHLKRGFRDIGYHFVIRLDGTVETGRPLGMPGAHCKGYNSSSVGVCYVGGLENDAKTPADTRTPAQRMALQSLLRELSRIFPNADIRSHRDFAAKACPCFDATAEYRGL